MADIMTTIKNMGIYDELEEYKEKMRKAKEIREKIKLVLIQNNFNKNQIFYLLNRDNQMEVAFKRNSKIRGYTEGEPRKKGRKSKPKPIKEKRPRGRPKKQPETETNPTIEN